MTDDSFDPPAPERRASPRSNMFLAAMLEVGSEQAAVKIRNMSSHGAMIATPLQPPVGTQVLLTRGPLKVQGEVVWCSGERCGLKLASAVSVSEWMALPGNIAQQRVDEIVAWVKSGGAPPAEPFQQDNRATGRSPDQLVDDLGAIFRLMQDLEDDLLSSPDTLLRHETKLQNLDIAMQMLSALAREVKPESADPTRSMARLEDLRAVCNQALRPKPE
jgi:hypothetical protein